MEPKAGLGREAKEEQRTVLQAGVEVLSSYRRAERVHFILDNYIIHSSKKTQQFLEQFKGKKVLHFLPPYCPDGNRVEWERQNLPAKVMRKHKLSTIDELLLQVFTYLKNRQRGREGLSLRRALDYAAS